MRASQTWAHEIELSSRHRSDGSAIVVVTSCREELLGIDRDPQSTRKRSLVRSPQFLGACLENEHRLAQHGEVAAAVSVLIRLTDEYLAPPTTPLIRNA